MYVKELNKATYYVNEIKETVNTSVKEDLLSAYEKICDVNKTLEASANLVKDAMLEVEKSFEEVKGWSHTPREDFVPIHELRSRLRMNYANWRNRSCKDRRKIGLKRSLSSKWNWRRRRLSKKWPSLKQ